ASNAAMRAFSRANVWSRSIHCSEESDGSNMSSMARTCAILAAPVMESVIRLLYRIRHGKRTRNGQYLLIFHIIILEYLSKEGLWKAHRKPCIKHCSGCRPEGPHPLPCNVRKGFRTNRGSHLQR